MAMAADQTAAFCVLLQTEGAAFEGRLAQGTPSPQQLLGFLNGLVSRAGPLVGACRPDVVSETRGGFTSIGWDVATNAPIAGSQPPDPAEVLAMLKLLNQKLSAASAPSLLAAPGAAGVVG
jgi:hypothetical protein